MIERLIHRILLRRHFWRYATFSEIAELYSSRLLRMMALNITASFMSIFLYQIGYSVMFIVGFWAVFFTLKALSSLPAARLVMWIGPKHAMLVGNLLYIPAMIAFALVPQYGLWALGVALLFKCISVVVYNIAYVADFSKVKSIDHAGKEIANMNIIEKLTAGLSPLLGGLLAFAFGPTFVMIVAAVLFALSAAPLMATAEQVRPKRHLSFKGFPWHLLRPMGLAHLSVGFDVFTTTTAWSLFYAIFIIGIASSNEIYAVTGVLSSVVLFACAGGVICLWVTD
jgi:MFS family permease